MKSSHLRTLCICILASAFTACETTAPPESGGEEAGTMEGGESTGGEVVAGETNAGETMAGETMAGENMAGESMAGESMAGVNINFGGEEGGAEDETPTFDPNQPLPEPTVPTQMPPTQIAEPGEGEVDADCQGHYFNQVRGWVVDEVGEPMPGARVQLCVREYESGTLVCLTPKKTKSEGFFEIPVTESARCMSSATLRTLVPNVAFAPIYCHGNLDQDTGDGVLRITEPLTLYQTRPAVSIADAEEEGLSIVSLIGEIQLTLNPENLYGPTIDEIGGRPLSPSSPGLCFLNHSEEGPQVDGVIAFAPEGDITRDTAQITIPNDMDYAPGSQVQLYVLGNLDCSIEGEVEPLEEGDWVPTTIATVDEGGLRIQTEVGSGIPCLSWLGYGPVIE